MPPVILMACVGRQMVRDERTFARLLTSWSLVEKAIDEGDRTLRSVATTGFLEALAAEVDLGNQGTVETHPVVVSEAPDEVVLDDCAVEDSTEYDSSGAIVDPSGPVNYNFRIVMVLEDGRWKTSEMERREAPCEVP